MTRFDKLLNWLFPTPVRNQKKKSRIEVMAQLKNQRVEKVKK